MRFLLSLGVVLILVCAGAGVALYTGAISMSEPSDAASPTPSPRPAPVKPAGAGTAAPATAPAAGTAAPAGPQPTVTNQKTFGDWIYSCLTFPNGAPTQCSISQQLSDTKTKQPVFLWRIAQDGKGGLVGIWQTPTGVMVNHGIVLDAGTPKPIAIPFEYCGQGGCEAVGNLAPDFLDSLTKAQKASATIYARGEKGLTFPLSVKGLSDGLAALKQ